MRSVILFAAVAQGFSMHDSIFTSSAPELEIVVQPAVDAPGQAIASVANKAALWGFLNFLPWKWADIVAAITDAVPAPVLVAHVFVAAAPLESTTPKFGLAPVSHLVFSALIGQVISFRLIHFGYLPHQSYLLFGTIFATIFMVYIFNTMINKNKINDWF